MDLFTRHIAYDECMCCVQGWLYWTAAGRHDVQRMSTASGEVEIVYTSHNNKEVQGVMLFHRLLQVMSNVNLCGMNPF